VGPDVVGAAVARWPNENPNKTDIHWQTRSAEPLRAVDRAHSWSVSRLGKLTIASPPTVTAPDTTAGGAFWLHEIRNLADLAEFLDSSRVATASWVIKEVETFGSETSHI
jgi:hypothetical protein